MLFHRILSTQFNWNRNTLWKSNGKHPRNLKSLSRPKNLRWKEATKKNNNKVTKQLQIQNIIDACIVRWLCNWINLFRWFMLSLLPHEIYALLQQFPFHWSVIKMCVCVSENFFNIKCIRPIIGTVLPIKIGRRSNSTADMENPGTAHLYMYYNSIQIWFYIRS